MQNKTIAAHPPPPVLNMLPRDLSVALLLMLALGATLLLRGQVQNQTTAFAPADVPLTLAYPQSWSALEPIEGTLLAVEDPLTDSAFKTRFQIEARELDPASPLDLETLVNRRIEQRSQEQLGYQFLSSEPMNIGGVEAIAIEYAYVVQPIDEPLRFSLPVVVRTREVLATIGTRSYLLLLSAPEHEFDAANVQFDRILASTRLQ